MNEHLYYALKYFCRHDRLENTFLYGGEFWNTPDGICKFAQEWTMGGDSFTFTYHDRFLNFPIEVVNNYTTEMLYEMLSKR